MMAAVTHSARLATPARSLSSASRRRSTTGRRAMRCVAAATVEKGSVSLVLLAGGVGKRMGANMPKQYLPLLGTPIALYSLKKFAEMEEVGEIVVVCDPSYQDLFEDCPVSKPVKFALPGKERQDLCSTASPPCERVPSSPPFMTRSPPSRHRGCHAMFF